MDPSNLDKAFCPRTEGQVLGVNYDSVTMTWYLRQDTISAILPLIETMLEDGEKLCGKLVDIRCLIEGSKFQFAHRLDAVNTFTEREDMERVVQRGDWCWADLY